MMASPPSPMYMVPEPVAVVGREFLVPYPVDLAIVRKMLSLKDGNFLVIDVNGSVVFTIKHKLISLHDRHLLLDASGNTIMTFMKKMSKETYKKTTKCVFDMVRDQSISMHRRWVAYRGNSSDPKDLLFSVKKSSLIQFKTELDIFLAKNVREEVCDFKMRGSYFERSCVITSGYSNAIVAQMHKQLSIQSIALGKDTFGVTVYPQVDYAFIVGLVVILDEINDERDDD